MKDLSLNNNLIRFFTQMNKILNILCADKYGHSNGTVKNRGCHLKKCRCRQIPKCNNVYNEKIHTSVKTAKI